MSSKEQNIKPTLKISYPEELPVSQRRDEIRSLIERHQVVIVCGETGSGKTTQLPKMCLDLGRGLQGKSIVHTQPRRLAATATAKRIAQELGVEIGTWVGYKIRFQDKSANHTAIKLVTDGILLAETQSDPLLLKYDTIIIDEAHERSLNIDFLLGYLKSVLPKRPDLKLIVTSATIDSERFSKHFEGTDGQPAPVIEVSGRLYPVRVDYLDPAEFDAQRRKDRQLAAKGGVGPGQSGRQGSRIAKSSARSSTDNRADEVDEDAFNEASLQACETLFRLGAGDILFFLPGEREIRDMNQYLARQLSSDVELLPLFARLTAVEQERIFKPSGRRRVVLSTNVAETSLTVPGIRYVIDSGMARVKRYSYRNKVEMLQVERISKASANQRAGRCGRVADGVCIRLYSQEDFDSRPDYTDPEILRASLASVILRMKSLHLADVEEFPFLQKPLGRAIADGYQLLAELHALDDEGRLTDVGRSLSKLPLDPRIARMLLAASRQGCLAEVLIIASGLSIQDPRERPHEAQEAADLAHQQFLDADSDFVGLLNIWNYYQQAKSSAESSRGLRQALSKKFLSPNRLREWSEVHQQLASMVQEHHWKINEQPSTVDLIHQALLTGLLGNIGLRHETDPIYLGARSIRFAIHPASALHKKGGKWVMAAELVETTRLYARTVARIQPEWVEKAAAHLIKRNHANPHWEKNSGQAVALETGSVYGLPVYSQRRISLARFDPAMARRLMIQEGLVPCEVRTQLPFYLHNQKLMHDVEKLEHQARRQDILIDPSLIAQFYEERLPAGVVNLHTLEQWAKQASREDLTALMLNKEDLLSKRAGGITTDYYPKKMEIGGLSFELNYHFEPGSPRDGVTMTVPLALLNQVPQARCEWLVPGMLKEKVHQLLKSLPQKLRRHCVPLPQFAENFVQSYLERNAVATGEPGLQKSSDVSLLEALRLFVVETTPARPLTSDFRLDGLPAHHFMNFKLVDEHGRQLDMQRNLAALKAEWTKKAQDSFKQHMGGQALAQLSRSGPDAPKQSGGNEQSTKVQASSPASATNNYSDTQWTDWGFGALPELLEIKKAGQVLFGYPALKDCESHCIIEVYDEQHTAAAVHREGVLRLFAIQLKEPLKYLQKNLLDFQKIAMLYMSLGSSEELQHQWIKLALIRGALAQGLPSDANTFAEACNQAKVRINLIAQEIGRTLSNILNEYSRLTKRLQTDAKSFPSACQDIQSQLDWLMPKQFLLKHPYEQLAHFPRYLKAAHIRLERLRNDSARDAVNQKDLLSLQVPWQRAVASLKGFEDEGLVQFGWQLQELRVSLFAQELRTPMPVSVKRLQKIWETLSRRN